MMVTTPKKQTVDNVGGAKKEKRLGECDLETGWSGKCTKVFNQIPNLARDE